MRAIERARIFIAHTEVEGEPLGRFPVVLHEEAVLVVPQHGAAESTADPTLKGSTGQYLGKFVSLDETGTRRSDGIKIERTRWEESIIVIFPPWTEFKTCLHCMQANAVAYVVHHLSAGFAEMQRLEICSTDVVVSIQVDGWKLGI